MGVELTCTECEKDFETEGKIFGGDVTCPNCGIVLETDWDYTDIDEGCMAHWVVGKAKDQE